MQPTEFYRTLKVDTSPLEALGFNPYYQPWSGLQHGRPSLRGQLYYDLASNDYLGLASDARVDAAAVAALHEYGASQCGTPIATGHAQILADLEGALARFTGLEAARVFPSCYQANLALFPAIAKPADLIIVDHYAHASLALGIKSVGCKVKPFLHNDLAHLEKQLAGSAAYRQTFVVTESVFSTEGTVAPLDGIVGLCRKFAAVPVVDDSHGIGVLGKTGRGILEEKALDDYDGIYTASLGKALAHMGGVIAGRRDFIEALSFSCAGLIYSTALTPVCAGGLLCVLQIIEQEFAELQSRLWHNHRRLVAALRRGGLEVLAGAAPIAAIPGGSVQDTLALARRLFEHGLLGTPFVPPSVPPGQGILRLIVGAKLDEPAMQGLLETLGRVFEVK